MMAKTYRFNFKRLDVYRAAVEHFGWVVEVVGGMPRAPFSLTNQFLGAPLSIMANIGEADGREKKPGETEQHYRYAQGSTYESAAYLDALSEMRAIDDAEYNLREENLARIEAEGRAAEVQARSVSARRTWTGTIARRHSGSTMMLVRGRHC